MSTGWRPAPPCGSTAPPRSLRLPRAIRAGFICEGFTRLTYEIKEGKGGVSRVTVTHDLEGAPGLALLVSGAMDDQGADGGWSWVLSDLKSLLETGSGLEWQGGSGPKDA